MQSSCYSLLPSRTKFMFLSSLCPLSFSFPCTASPHLNLFPSPSLPFFPKAIAWSSKRPIIHSKFGLQLRSLVKSSQCLLSFSTEISHRHLKLNVFRNGFLISLQGLPPTPLHPSLGFSSSACHFRNGSTIHPAAEIENLLVKRT